MPTKQLTTNKSYPKLLSDLKSILLEGLKKIEEQRVKTYWQTGEMISEYLLEGKQRGDGLFIRLSEDLEIDQRTLYHSVGFYQAFPSLSTCSNLTWSQYRILSTVEDKSRRDFLEDQAVKLGWDARRLQQAIKIERLKWAKRVEPVETVESVKLKFTRGKLYTYRLIKPKIINPTESELLVDCGFSIWRDVALLGITSPGAGEIVESRKSGSYYSFNYSAAKSSQLFTFKALVERVVDADTIWVHIDLGFNCWSRQKIRFRGIDAPEVSTAKGIKAKEFVEDRLAGVPFVIIKTHSPDKYDRYLSDVFYKEGESSPEVALRYGKYLNQELLDLGLAVGMTS
ncbi:DUF1016 N-terminal domain-containing protein [Candidatus Omnitrophota bacterium]